MDRWLNISELAEHLGVPRTWVRDKVTARQLPHHRAGRHVRFTPEDIAAIEAMTAEPVAAGPSPLALLPRATHPPAGPSTPTPPAGPREAAKPSKGRAA